MKASFLLAQPTAESQSAAPTSQAQPMIPSADTDNREYIRHILLGSPEVIRRTIHRLHGLGYVEATLWSPAMHPDNPLVITPQPNEVMKLLRRQI